jgi:CubicO group peptidase (beta-lactamase class C family)
VHSRKKIIMAIVFILLLAPSPKGQSPATRSRDYASLQKQVEEYARKLMDKKNIKGISIALVDDQTLVFAEGYGWADEKNKKAATADTIFQAGAISKIFTALAVMKILEQGKINLDTPISRYIPEASVRTRFNNAKPVTAKALLTQHSGLPSDILKGMYTKHKPIPFAEYMKKTLAYLKEEYQCAPPGDVFAYSNLGFTLLGHLAEVASKENFVSYTDREFFKAMDMQHSSFSLEKHYGDLTKGYFGGKETPLLKLNALPAISLHSNSIDMANFIRMILAEGTFRDKKIIGAKTLKSMTLPQNPEALYDLDFQIGLGWQLDGYNIIYDEKLRYDGRVLWQGGSTIMNNAALFILPEAKLGAVVFGNSSGGLVETGNIALRCLNLALEMKTGRISHEKKEAVSSIINLSAAQMKSIEGHYSSEYVGFLSIKEKEGHIAMEAMGQAVTLVPHADGSFSLQYYLLGFIPINIELLDGIRFKIDKVQGKTAIVLLKNHRRYLGGIRIEKPEITNSWKARVGIYKIVDSGDDALLFDDPEIVLIDGFLILKAKYSYLRNMSVMLPLQPVSDTECVITGLGRNMGQTVKFIHVNGETLLTYSGLILKKMR